MQVGDIRAAQGERAWQKHGALVLTFHPAVVGGGPNVPAFLRAQAEVSGAGFLQVHEGARESLTGSSPQEVSQQLRPLCQHSATDSRRQSLAQVLSAIMNEDIGSLLAVEIQVLTECLWRGSLPAAFLLASLEALWTSLSAHYRLPPACRIFTGPFPCPYHTLLSDLHEGVFGPVFKRGGHIVLTIHPACVGGGAKVENGEWTGSRVASLCLGRGCPLVATTAFVESILAKAGVSKVMTAIASGPEPKRWDALIALAQASSVPMPAIANRVARRVQKTTQRKKEQHDRLLRAHEVKVEPGFFTNEDGTPSTILEQVTPGATGLVLTDLPEAAQLCSTLEGIQPDELAVLVLGHECPDPHSCDGSLSFPAQSVSAGTKVLLAGCLHNFGDRKVKCNHSTKADVELADVTCCHFAVYLDEIDPARWKSLTETPVRVVAEMLQQAGISGAFNSPWGRSFAAQGRPAVPAQAESLSFHARVEADKLHEVLKISGQVGVYVTPKQWDRSPHPDFAVVWTGSARADATTAALKVPEQLGIVRSKGSFGVRVPELLFSKIHSLLRPGVPPPTRVQVTRLFRVGPIPQKAGQAWANLCSWQVRVMKSLGPGHWLLGSNVDPPSVYPAFNERQGRQAVVQSGVLPTTACSASTEDPWTHTDPWKTYRTAKGLPTPSKVPAPQLPAREVIGPTEKRFQEQESRLTALEQKLTAVQGRQDAFCQEVLDNRERI